MSFPINPANLAAAANLISGAAERVGEALNFEQVLHGAAANEAESPSEPANWLDDSIQRIRELLSGSGIQLREALQLSVAPDAEPRVSGAHPRSAEIESLLASDPQLRQLLTGLVESAGPAKLTVQVSETTR